MARSATLHEVSNFETYTLAVQAAHFQRCEPCFIKAVLDPSLLRSLSSVARSDRFILVVILLLTFTLIGEYCWRLSRVHIE